MSLLELILLWNITWDTDGEPRYSRHYEPEQKDQCFSDMMRLAEGRTFLGMYNKQDKVCFFVVSRFAKGET